MLTTGAADGDGYVVLVFLGVSFQRNLDSFLISVEKFLGSLAGKHVVGDRLVVPGKLAQVGHPERVGQKTHVGHEIGVDGHTVFEAEAEDVYCHGGGAGAEHRLVEFGGQLVDAQGAGVDDPVGSFLEVFQQVTFLKDAVDQSVAVLQRVRAAHGFIALDEHFVAGVEEQNTGFDAEIIQMAEHGGQLVEIAGAHVDDGGKLVDA